jgi:hypothetical protein
MLLRRVAFPDFYEPWPAQPSRQAARWGWVQRQRDRRVERTVIARGRALHEGRRSGAARSQCACANHGNGQSNERVVLSRSHHRRNRVRPLAVLAMTLSCGIEQNRRPHWL